MLDCRRSRTVLVYLLPIALLIGSLFVGRYQTPVSVVVEESMKAFSYLFFGTPASVSTHHTVL
ncbi:MAG: iron ABC transporter permease, partial [Methanosarcina sp.]|nr:iron ABC transporter permease [Methanosarcina sp.]